MRLAGDADELELAWLNLLENAVEASPAGGRVELTCAALADARDGAIEVTVRDQGPGIAAAERAHIFERFRRGTHAAPGGFGLGLAIARAILAAHGGTLELDAESNLGACFRARLPLAHTAAAAES